MTTAQATRLIEIVRIRTDEMCNELMAELTKTPDVIADGADQGSQRIRAQRPRAARVRRSHDGHAAPPLRWKVERARCGRRHQRRRDDAPPHRAPSSDARTRLAIATVGPPDPPPGRPHSLSQR